MVIHLLTFSNASHPSPVTKHELDMFHTAANTLGHTLEVIYARNCELHFGKSLAITHQGNALSKIPALLVRANFLDTDPEYFTTTIRQFDLLGIPLINNAEAIAQTKNKVRMLQTLTHRGIPIPHTVAVRSAEHLGSILQEVGEFPVIMKSASGSHGAGVSIIETKRGLRSAIEMMVKNEYSAPLLIQSYLKDAKGTDIRIVVVGDYVIGAMERRAGRRGEFRSNVKLGGTVHSVVLTAAEEALALEATRALNLDIAGVDLVRTKNGPYILEVNSNPGLDGISTALGRNIAEDIITFALTKTSRL